MNTCFSRSTLMFALCGISGTMLTACGGGSNGPDVVDYYNHNAPIVDAGVNQTVDEQSEVTIVASASDDGSITSVSWIQTSGESVELSGSDSQTLTFTAPTLIESQTLTFEFVATDNDGVSSKDNVDVVVMPVNALPVVTIGDDVIVDGQMTVSLTAQGSDLDGQIDSYLWQQSAGTEVMLTGVDTDTLSFTAPVVEQSQTLSFVVSVTDNEGGEASQSVDVTVNPIVENQAPTVTLSRDLWRQQQTPVTLTAQYNDSDGEVVAFNWSQIDGPAITLENTTSETLTFTTPAIESNQATVNLRLEVTDNLGATSHDELEILVSTLEMNTFNGQSFSAGQTVTWEATNVGAISYEFESELDIGFDQHGVSASIKVPYMAEPTEIHMVRRGSNNKVYLQDTVQFMPDDTIGFAKTEHQALPQDLPIDGKTTIYRDFDADGWLDLVVYDQHSLSWYRGTQTGFSVNKVIVDDLNTLSAVKVVKQTAISSQFSLLAFSANGAVNHYYLSQTGQGTVDFVAGGNHLGVQNSEHWNVNAGFLNDDDMIDVAGSYMLAGKLHLVWFEVNQTDITLHQIDSDVLGSEKAAISIADINGDSRNDIVVLAQNSDVVTFVKTDEGYQKQVVVNVADSEMSFKPMKLLPTDINRDGLIDFVVLRKFMFFSGVVTYRLNGLINGDNGTFWYGEDIESLEAQFAEQFTLADIDDDGFEDIVLLQDFYDCNTCVNFTITRTGFIGWKANDGTIDFAETKRVGYPAIHTSISAGHDVAGSVMHVLDINGDGKNDVAHGYQLDGFKLHHYLRQ